MKKDFFKISFCSTNLKTLEFTISMSTRLLETCLSVVTIRDNLDCICQVIKLLLASICRQRREADESADQERRQKNENDAIKALLAILKARLGIDLSPYMPYYYGGYALANELLVC